MLKELFGYWLRWSEPDESELRHYPFKFLIATVPFWLPCAVGLYIRFLLTIRAEKWWDKFSLGWGSLLFFGFLVPRFLRSFVALLYSGKDHKGG